MFCALLVPAAASARPLVGIGDHDAASFQDPAMRKLGLKTARLTLVWDWHKDPGIVAGTDAWVAAVKEARMRPLITFTRNWRRSGRRYIPSLKRYVHSFRLLRERYPHVREFSPWNEPNAKEQPFYRKPGRAALYFNAMRKECRRCTVLAGDVKDGTSMLPWLSVYKRYVRGAKVWALHNYKDATRGRGGTAEFLRAVRGSVWLTETGGIRARGGLKGQAQGGPAGVRARPLLASDQAGLLLSVAVPRRPVGLGVPLQGRQAPARLLRAARRAAPLGRSEAGRTGGPYASMRAPHQGITQRQAR